MLEVDADNQPTSRREESMDRWVAHGESNGKQYFIAKNLPPKGPTL